MHSANVTAFSRRIRDPVDHGVGGRETRLDLVVAGLSNTTPVIVVRSPSIQRMARNAKQPPAASSDPVLTPTNPLRPSSVSVLCTVPATGGVTLGVATMAANTGRRMARLTMRSSSAAVDTVMSS